MRARVYYTLIFTFHCFASFALANDFGQVTGHDRRGMIRRAHIWSDASVSSKDLFSGPKTDGGFEFDETVHCKYVKKKRSGTSPKFYCRLASGDVVKVRYGEGNEEVYAQVAASRLLWALGFGTNANYLVRVDCHGCSDDPWNQPDAVQQSVLFSPATIERKVKGVEIHEEGKSKQGWGWDEIERIDEQLGGASRAQIDALKLLGVFISHVDSRPDNQKLVCLEDGIQGGPEKARCTKPFMFISDLGTTFGGEHEYVDFTTLKLRYWKYWPIWRDPKNCIAYLKPAEKSAGMLRSPKISEAGRSFLANLLAQLSDQQIRDLFRAAKADHVEQSPGYASIDEWVQAFKERRNQILDQRCSD